MEIVIFDGMSGSGKSTLRKRLDKHLAYGIISMDRFTPSCWVYEVLRGRDNTKFVVDFEDKFEKNYHPLLVICHCHPHIARARDVTNEVMFGYYDERHMFFKYVNEVSRYSRLMMLDTGVHGVEDCINIVQEKIKG